MQLHFFGPRGQRSKLFGTWEVSSSMLPLTPGPHIGVNSRGNQSLQVFYLILDSLKIPQHINVQAGLDHLLMVLCCSNFSHIIILIWESMPETQ